MAVSAKRLCFLIGLVLIGVGPTNAQTFPLRQGNGASSTQLPNSPGVVPTAPKISLPASQRRPWITSPVADDVMTLGAPKPGPVDLTGQISSKDAATARPGAATSVPASSSAASASSLVGSRITGIPKVVDGNTLVVGGQVVVLNGADAPEINQTCVDQTGLEWRCGERASRHLQDLIGATRIVCTGVSDLAGAVAATCLSGNTDFAKVMVRDGFAVVPPGLAPLYAWEQSDARFARRGVWNGTFRYPWDYRSRN